MDHLSRGRLDLRLAVGASDAETRAAWERHGIRYPDGRARVAALEAAVEVLDHLLRGETVDTSGPFGRLHQACLEPRPIQQPRPPLWIAAMRPQALALTARRADGWEASYVNPETFATLGARLDALLATEGRAPRAVRRSVEVDVIVADSPAECRMWIQRFAAERGSAAAALLPTALVGDPEAIAARILAYAGAGATDLMLGFVDFPATTMLELIAREVVPRLARAVGSGLPPQSRMRLLTGELEQGAKSIGAGGRRLVGDRLAGRQEKPRARVGAPGQGALMRAALEHLFESQADVLPRPCQRERQGLVAASGEPRACDRARQRRTRRVRRGEQPQRGAHRPLALRHCGDL